MDQIKEFLSPLTDKLPPEVRAFLDAGGWWAVLGVAAFLVLWVGWALLRRLGKALFGRQPEPRPNWEEELREDLRECPLPVRPPGERRLTVYHIPVRLRLVIVAPVGTAGDVDATAVEKLLDRVVPGLGDIARHDRPRIRVWPTQLSQHGFNSVFHRCTLKPEPEGEPSQWILVSGRTQFGRQPLLLGLGLWADEANTVGRMTLEQHQWLDVLRLRSAEG
jgi:hypothetical protein